MGDIEPWVAATQTSLGQVIKAPKLAEKLLRKPPFRFLHDIVTSFMKTTGHLGGLFAEDELVSENVKEKDAKIQFLQKLITTIQHALGQEIDVRATKIISGSEPENTNAMLQALAQVAGLPKPQVAAAVDKTLGRAQAEPPKAQTPPQEEKPKPKPKPEPKVDQPPQQQTQPPQQQQQPPSRGGQPQNPSPSSSDQQQRPARPGTATARQPPPQERSNVVQEERHDLKETAPAQGVIREQKAGAASDANGGDDADGGEEDWMKLVEKQKEQEAMRAAQGNTNQSGGGGGTYLEQQAMEAKRQQEEAARKEREEAEAQGQRNEGLVLNTRKKGGQESSSGAMGSSELAKLREQLQLLTKASNPLGKFLEAIHEDIDTMGRELDMWRTEARNQATAAQQAQQQSDEALRAIQAQHQVLEDSINDQLLKINIVRAQIIQNDRTIEKLVRMVVNPDKK